MYLYKGDVLQKVYNILMNTDQTFSVKNNVLIQLIANADVIFVAAG